MENGITYIDPDLIALNKALKRSEQNEKITNALRGIEAIDGTIELTQEEIEYLIKDLIEEILKAEKEIEKYLTPNPNTIKSTEENLITLYVDGIAIRPYGTGY